METNRKPDSKIHRVSVSCCCYGWKFIRPSNKSDKNTEHAPRFCHTSQTSQPANQAVSQSADWWWSSSCVRYHSNDMRTLAALRLTPACFADTIASFVFHFFGTAHYICRQLIFHRTTAAAAMPLRPWKLSITQIQSLIIMNFSFSCLSPRM